MSTNIAKHKKFWNENIPGRQAMDEAQTTIIEEGFEAGIKEIAYDVDFTTHNAQMPSSLLYILHWEK